MTPVEALIDRPAGTPVAVHVYGAVPPDAVSVRLVAVPTVPVRLPGLVAVAVVPPPVRMACESSHWPAPPLVSLDQVPCSVYEPLPMATFAAPPCVPGLRHAHLSAFSAPEVSVQPPAGFWSVMVSEYS